MKQKNKKIGQGTAGTEKHSAYITYKYHISEIAHFTLCFKHLRGGRRKTFFFFTRVKQSSAENERLASLSQLHQVQSVHCGQARVEMCCTSPHVSQTSWRMAFFLPSAFNHYKSEATQVQKKKVRSGLFSKAEFDEQPP